MRQSFLLFLLHNYAVTPNDFPPRLQKSSIVLKVGVNYVGNVSRTVKEGGKHIVAIELHA